MMSGPTFGLGLNENRKIEFWIRVGKVMGDFHWEMRRIIEIPSHKEMLRYQIIVASETWSN